MTEPKSFKRGQRTYTRVGSHKEVRIDGTRKEMAEAPSAPFEVPSDVDQPVYANAAAVHRSPDEVILDLAFVSPRRPNPRVRSRVAMSPAMAGRLSRLLAKAAQER